MLCVTRCIQRLRGDLAAPVSAIAGNCILSIILGTLFYNLPEETSSFFARGALLFFTVLINTFLGAFEVSCSRPRDFRDIADTAAHRHQGSALWAQRDIVQKHFQYAFYRPAAEAIASMINDIPNKILVTFFFNVPFYFLANLRRTPAAVFTFYLFAFASLLTGSMLFRAIGAMSRTLTESIAPGAVFIMMLMISTGFALPIPSMRPWFRWLGHVDPVAYAFESMMINEVSEPKLLVFFFCGPSTY